MSGIRESLLRNTQEVPCPECQFRVWIRMSEVICQCTVRCPNCRVGLHLIDDSGAMTHEIDAMDRAVHSLERTIERMF